MKQLPNPTRSRAAYTLQAALIASSLVVTLASVIYVSEHDGSMWWLLAAAVALVAACGSPMLTTLNLIGAAIGSAEGMLFFVGIGLSFLLLPLLAILFLIAAVVQAYRAGPAQA